MSKFVSGLKNIGLSMVPLVEAYRYNPDTTDKASNPYIELRVKNITAVNPLEDSNQSLQQTSKTV